MAFTISRREVMTNLIRFRERLIERRTEEGFVKKEKGRRFYKALLNRRSGELRFAQKISSVNYPLRLQAKGTVDEWIEEGKIPHFEMKEGNNRPLNPHEFEPLAWRIISEMLEVLNGKAKGIADWPQHLLTEEVVLQDLSDIQLLPLQEQIEQLPGWMGSLSRIDAEKILESRPIGTYLLREGDELTLSISFHFEEENLLSIHPYLLTLVEEEGKISDHLLLKTNKGWTFYQDDPNLTDPILYHFSDTPQALLQTLSQKAQFPLRG